MHKFKLKYSSRTINILTIVFIVIVSCQNNNDKESSLRLIKDFKNLPAENLTEIVFENDTIFYNSALESQPIKARIFAKNTGTTNLQIGTVVASCNCTKVKFDKKIVFPKDSLWIDLIISNDKKSSASAITVVGNIPNGQKTIFLLPN